MSPDEHMMIKHAQNELVRLCGGIDDCKVIVPYGRSTIGRWADVGNPTLMPWPAVIARQKKCRVPVVTAALAAIDGRMLSDPVTEGETCVMTAMAEVLVVSGQLGGVFGAAVADGKLTPNELTDLSRVMERLERALVKGKRSAAAGRAEGGLKVVMREGQA